MRRASGAKAQYFLDHIVAAEAATHKYMTQLLVARASACAVLNFGFPDQRTG
jgi:hypothetical protein